jgi:hypothetical protein
MDKIYRGMKFDLAMRAWKILVIMPYILCLLILIYSLSKPAGLVGIVGVASAIALAIIYTIALGIGLIVRHLIKKPQSI